jgi:hypothetical protein
VRLWKNDPVTAEGKYLVQRRDGTVPQWPHFVMAASDPAVPAALRAYAREAERLGYDPAMVADLYALAEEFEQWRDEHGGGDPDAPRHREDDPKIIELMRRGRGS